MRHKSIFRVIIFTALLALTGAQCISFGGGATASTAGGVFKSQNNGAQWVQKATLFTSAGIKSFGGVNITSLSIDPEDHLALYAATRENGMFYSYDGGESWNLSNYIAKGDVGSIAVDPKNKCVIYAALDNQVMKSSDCNRTFARAYNEATPQTFVTAVAVSPFNSSVVFAGTSRGTFLKSVDGGASWSIRGNAVGIVHDIILDSRNSSVVYVSVTGRGIWKSINGGDAFQDMSVSLRSANANDVRRIVLDRATPDAILLASKQKLLRSTDGGATWAVLPTISREGVDITALAVNPKNSKEVYYGTASTFYRSIDGGQNWSTQRLPSTRQASALIVDPENPATIYMGMLEIKK